MAYNITLRANLYKCMEGNILKHLAKQSVVSKRKPFNFQLQEHAQSLFSKTIESLIDFYMQ